jgi:hypothetical protein
LRFLKTQINFEKACEASFFKIYLYYTKPKQAVTLKQNKNDTCAILILLSNLTHGYLAAIKLAARNNALYYDG